MAEWQKTRPDLVADGALSAWRWRAQAASVALAVGAVMLLASAAQAALLPTCPAPPPNNQVVVSLGLCCRITKPGDYALSQDLVVTSGACIKIAASGVTLDGSGYALSGNGTGVGVRLLPAAVGDVVYNFSSISGFKKGILDDAPRSVITQINHVTDNAGDGIVIRANRVYLTETDSSANGGNGVVVEPLAPASVVANVHLGSTTAYSNANAGFLLDSLSSLTLEDSNAYSNGTDGIDLLNSVEADIFSAESYANTLDGLKIIGGHNDAVIESDFGGYNSPNAIGLKVRNSPFDTFDDDDMVYNTGDGMLMVNGEGENITESYAAENGGSGMHLKRTTSSRVTSTDPIGNAGAGIWLDGSRGISVLDVYSEYNAKSNLYIGCSSAQKPDGTRCADVGLPASNGNRVSNGTFSYSSGVKPKVGIGIDKGNHHNQVLQNTATGNATDAVDKNKNCDSNQWMFNTFDTTFPAQPSCIQ